MQPKVNAVWDQFKAGKIDRAEAERQVMEISGGLRPMQWEGTPEGKSAAEGGVSFNHTQTEPRTLPPANTKEKVTVSLSAYTKSIPTLRRLRNLAAKGDEKAHALLQAIAMDATREVLRGTSAKLQIANVTGLYGGEIEQSLQVIISFNHAERNVIIGRLKAFAETFDQEQVHVLRAVKEKPGHQYADGSYSTMVSRWELSRALSKKEITKVIRDSNLYGLTFSDTFVTAYFVNQPNAKKEDGTPYTETEQLNDFITNAGRADVALGGKVSGTRREVARLWPYGDRGDGHIGWPGVPSGVSGEPGIRSESVRVAKQYIDGLKRSDGTSGEIPGGSSAETVKRSERRDGSVSAVGIHYSFAQRQQLSSAAFGSGLPGAELERVAASTDPRIQHRIYFYVNAGRAINPEAGVGAHAHRAELSNLYDQGADALDLKLGRDANAFESAILDAGFDGYLSHEAGIAVQLGQRSTSVKYMGLNNNPDVPLAERATPSQYRATLAAIGANRSLPMGKMSGADWKRLVPSLMPQLDVSHLTDDGQYYKNQLAAAPSEARPDAARESSSAGSSLQGESGGRQNQGTGGSLSRLATLDESIAPTPPESKESTPRIIGDSGREYTPGQLALHKRVGRETNDLTTLEKLKAWSSKHWVQGIVDQFAPVKDLSTHAYTLMRLSKGATGAFEAFMQHGKLSLKDGAYDADRTGGVMQSVFFPLGKETTDFLYWIAGNRAERLAMEGKERLFTPADMAAAKSLADGTTDFDYVLKDRKSNGLSGSMADAGCSRQSPIAVRHVSRLTERRPKWDRKHCLMHGEWPPAATLHASGTSCPPAPTRRCADRTRSPVRAGLTNPTEDRCALPPPLLLPTAEARAPGRCVVAGWIRQCGRGSSSRCRHR